MANNRQKMILDLEIDMRTAESQIKASGNKLKKAMANWGMDPNNMLYFKEVADYISDIDDKLAIFKRKYGDDLFAQIFGDFDSNLKKQLESAFGITKEQLTQIDQLKTKVASLKGSDATTKEDLKPIEQEIKSLYKAMGILDKLDMSGKGKIETRIQKIEAALKGFVVVMSGANDKIGKGLNNQVVNDMEDINAQLKKQADELKAIQKTVKTNIQAFYDAILDDADTNKLNSIKNTIKEALSFSDEDFLQFDKIFTGLEDGSIDEDEAIKHIVDAYEKIQEAKNQLNNNLSQDGDNSLKNAIETEVDEATKALEYGKKKLVAAWKDYYKATREAKAKGFDFLNGETSDAMDDIKYDIEDMLKQWGLNKKQIFTLGSFDEMIQDGDFGFKDIANEVDKAFQELANAGHPVELPVTIIPERKIEVEDATPDALENTEEALSEVSSEMEEVETKTKSTTELFQELIGYITQSGKGPKMFFQDLQYGFQDIDDNLYSILQSLKLIDEYGNIDYSTINAGATNKGGIVSDDHVLIAREDKKLKHSAKIQPKLLEAKNLGANVGAILEIYEDKANHLIYELQNKVKGEEIIDFKKGIVNTDFLDATEEQVEKLVEDLLILQKTGVYIDHGGGNILYDKDEGFSFIDLASGAAPFTAPESNTVYDNLDMFFDTALAHGASKDLIKKFANKTFSIAKQSGINMHAGNILESYNDAVDETIHKVDAEEDIHNKNADAINKENKALAAQIALKEKAQNMTWQEFALDDSLTTLKTDAGIQTLSDTELFWKKAKLDKKIDYHELSSDDEANDIINKYIPKKLQSKWYSSEKFGAKNALEKIALSYDEVMNAGMYKLWNNYNKAVGKPNGKELSFEDFLNTEFTMYRGDNGPVIYDKTDSLSFTYVDDGITDIFGSHKEAIQKIKPTELLGYFETSNSHDTEAEAFVPSWHLPNNPDSWYINGKTTSFDDYYNSQTEDIQRAINAKLLNLEKGRIKSLLGRDLIKSLEDSGVMDNYGLLNQFASGIIPNTLSNTQNDFDTYYNALPDTQKKLVAYYASLSQKFDENGVSGRGYSQKIGKTGFIDALITDNAGAKQHLAALTEEYKFGLLDQMSQIAGNISVKDLDDDDLIIEFEKESVENIFKTAIDKIKNNINDSLNSSNPDKAAELANIKADLESVAWTADKYPHELFDGAYVSNSTGELLNVKDILKQIQLIENTYGENLDYLYDYLSKVYGNLVQYSNNIPNNAQNVMSLPDVYDQVYDYAMGPDVSYNDWEKMSFILGGLSELETSKNTPDLMNEGKFSYYANSEWHDTNLSDFMSQIADVEQELNTDLSYVKQAIKNTFSDYFNKLEDILSVQDLIDKTSDLSAFDVKDKLGSTISGMDVNAITAPKISDLGEIYNAIESISQSFPSDIANGEYTSHLTGEILNINDLLQKIEDIEVLYYENLDYVKDYINQVYGNLEQSNADIQSYLSPMEAYDKLSEYLMSDDVSISEFESLQKIKSALYNMDYHPEEMADKIKSGMAEFYNQDDDTFDLINVSDLISHIEDVENEWNSDLSYVKQTLYGVYSDYFNQLQDTFDVPTEVYDTDIDSQSIGQKSGANTVIDLNGENSIQEETQLLNTLLLKIKDATTAVEDKTSEFLSEGSIVDQVITGELTKLNDLLDVLQLIRGELDIINQHFANMNVPANVPSINDVDAGLQAGHEQKIGDYALESTLQSTNDILDNIYKIFSGDNSDDSLEKAVTSLNEAVIEMQNVSKGIIEHQQKQIKTLDSSQRINTPAKRAYLSGIAANAVADNADNVDIEKIYAAADGLVGISGAVKNAEGVWEGFTLHINEANEAVDIATKKNSLYAKKLNETAEEANQVTKAVDNKGPSIKGQQKKYDILEQKAQDYIKDNELDMFSNKVKDSLNEYEQALNNLKAAQEKVANAKPENIDAETKAFNQAIGVCDAYDKKLKELLSTHDKFNDSHTNIKSLNEGDYVLDDIESKKQALIEYVNEFYKGEAKIKGFDEATEELNFTMKDTDGNTKNLSASFDKLGTSIGTAVSKAKATENVFGNFLNGITKEAAKLFRYFAARFGIEEIFQQFRVGIQYIRDIDLALTELKKVTNETDATYDRFLQTASKTAGVIGSTVSELTTMSAEWAKLGYNIQEAASLAESTAILLNVSEFTDATQASEALISTIQAFGYAAEDSMDVVDILNEVGNNFAISSDGIATALQDSASALMAGGNSMEEATAMIAAANKVVQDPNQVGSGLRTISLRLRGTSVSEELEKLGEDTEGLVSASKMRSKIKGLAGVDILTDTGAYKSTYQIITEIARVWEDMSDMDQAALLELMAGKNRSNIMAALLGNLKDLEGAYKTAMDAEGSALRENEAYLDSIQGRIDLFINAVQTMWMNLLDSNVMKGVIDFGTTLIKILDTLPGKIALVVSGFAVYKRVTTEGLTFKKMFVGVSDGFKEAFAAIKSMTVATQALTQAEIEQTLVSHGVSKAFAEQILTEAGLKGVTGALTKDQIKQTAATLTQKFATHELSAAQYLATMSTMGLKTAMQGLWNVLKANPVYAVAAAVTAGAIALDALHTTAQEAADSTKEAFDEINSIVESTESTIQSLESELDTINNRIDELSGKELSFAEDQELKKLEAQRGELERSLKIQENILELQKKSQAEQAVASMKAYTKAASQGAKETQSAWTTALATIGAAVGIAGAAFLTGGVALVPTIAGAAAGGIAGNKVGEVAGSAVTQNKGTYDSWYETYTKALETSRKEEQEALEKYQKDSSNIEKLDKWQEAQQKVADIETEMYNHMSQMQQYYNTLEYGISDEIDKELDTWYNFLDKFAIEQKASGAEVSALDRIFGENASKEIKDIKKQIRDASRAGKDFDFSTAINSSEELKSSLEYLGLTAQDVENYFTQLGEKAFVDKSVESFKSYSALSSQVESYNGVLSQTSEYVADNVKITQEYKDSLTALGISEKKLNECFYEGNPLVVKNAKALNELVNASRDNVEANIDLAQSQSRLDYYDLVTELNDVCDVTRDLTSAEIERANSIMNQIDLVQQQIYKYQLLKETLSDTGLAYQNYKDAQEIDALNTTGDNFVEMAQTIYDAFNVNGQVGTQAFNAAVEALVPDDVYASLESDGDKLVAIYKYFNNKVLPSLTLDEDKLSLDNIDVENFVEKGLNKGIFEGSANDGLAAKIGMSYEEAAKKVGMTVNQFKAYLAELEKYDYNTSAESFLSQFDQSFDGQVSHITSKMQELNEEKMRLLSLDGGYEANKDRIIEINKALEICNGDLKELQTEAVASYEEFANNKQAIEGLETIEDKTRELTKKEANALGIEWDEVKGKTVQEAIDYLTEKKLKLTELTPIEIQFAQQGINEEIDSLIDNIEKDKKIKLGVEVDKDTGEVEVDKDSKYVTRDAETGLYTVNIEGEQGEALEKALNTSESLASYLDDGVVTTDEHLENIHTVLSEIYAEISGKESSTTKDTTTNKGSELDAINTNDIASISMDDVNTFFTETIPKEWNDFWDSVGSFTDTIGAEAQDLYNAAVAFFTETIPETWDSFWEEVGSFIDEFISDAQDLYDIVSDFFTNTLPKAWSDFWNEAYDFVTEDIAYAIGWVGKEIARFFTETMPEAWDDFWSTIGTFFSETLPSALDNIDACIAEFFTQTVPKAWSDFWDTIGNFFGETLPAALDVIGGYISNFFTQTIPYHWNAFWSVISNFFTQTIPTALSTIGSHIGNFFTVTIPYHWNNFWSTVGNFFAETIPSALTTIGTTISTFFTQTIPGYISNLFSSIGSSIWSFVTNFGANVLQGWKDNNGSNSYGGSGSHGVNGTAHAKGSAHATGNWGLSTNEKDALVGELGQELVVDPHSGRYYTVGDNGAEMVNLPKGAIVFNHKQTEGLLKNGYVTSRGKAYANGNTHIEGPAHAMWSVEEKSSGLSSSSYRATKSGKSKSSSKKTSDYSDDFEEVFDWFEVRIEEINEQLDLMGAKLENAISYTSKNKILDSMIATNKEQLTTLEKGVKLYEEYASDLYYKIPQAYRDEAKNGKIAIEEFAGAADEKTLEAIKNYREWAQKVADLKVQLQEVKREIEDLAKQKIDTIFDRASMQSSIQEKQNERIQADIDYDEERGYITSGRYYEDMAVNIGQQIDYYTDARKAMQKSLDESVKAGDIIKYSDAWYEAIEQMYEVDALLDECTLSLEEYQNAINQIHWDNFDELINRFDYLQEEVDSLIDLMDKIENPVITPETDDGWSADEVAWSDEGLAQLGLYAEKMELAKYQADKYAEEINYLNEEYKAGKYSETEYLEKLNELKQGQYDSIQAYNDAKDAIVELNEARVDAIKEGIELELEAYSELIDKKKEELDAEKDLYDFRKSVMSQQKDITKLERQLAALSGDNSASARAKKKQLEAELAEARQELEESYYDRSVENQQNALDKELENFEIEKDAEMEALDKYLEDTELVVSDTLSVVAENSSVIYSTLNEKAKEYGLNLSDAVTKPWKDGIFEMEAYEEGFTSTATSVVEQIEKIEAAWQKVIDKMDKAAKAEIAENDKEIDTYTNAEKATTPSKSSSSSTSNKQNSNTTKAAPKKGDTVKVDKSATNFSSKSNNVKMASFVPGGTYTVMQTSGSGSNMQVLIGKNGAVTGWVKLKDLQGYAKGSKKIDKDQWAIIDELGEEMQLVPDGNGRLAYIKKGTGILTADMTERLMNIAMNPQDMLDRNRPSVKISPEVHNTEVNLNIQYGDMLRIENFKGDNPEEIAKIVAKQFEKHTKDLNNSLRKYVR